MKKVISVLFAASLTFGTSSLLVSCGNKNEITDPENNNNNGGEGNGSNSNLNGYSSFWVLSVGNANYTFLQNEDRAIVFDVGVGMAGAVNEGLSDDEIHEHDSKATETGNWKMDSDERTQWVVDYMKKVAGVKYIDAILISHKHQDHFSALANTINNFEVGTVVAPMDNVGLEKTIHNLKRGENVRVDTSFSKNYQFMGVNIENLSAYASKSSLDSAYKQNPNSTSAIWRFTVNEKTFLLPGDMQDYNSWKSNSNTSLTPIMKDPNVQNKIKEKPIDIYLPAHHGSANSAQSITKMIGQLSRVPEYVIISGTTATKEWKNYANALVFPDERPNDLSGSALKNDPTRGRLIHNIMRDLKKQEQDFIKITGVAPKSVRSVSEYDNSIDYAHLNNTFEYNLTKNNEKINQMIHHEGNIINKIMK
ncbi:MBL fold metallo-hydrolase [Mesoplasma coleopterae]|uniref:Metallo-beta-lactamase domain-containing protein n=1 Tax=Mesoplasma coleopterae TaxID=324078 RepID=A0A2K8P1A9_9MOLU|nr:MBL fold metallo-hydrolase [Mesoplasma coleopterae]ATZ20541.1 hypothetical protein MCOLE_v1c00260 [Mesoplasma coleopterae]